MYSLAATTDLEYYLSIIYRLIISRVYNRVIIFQLYINTEMCVNTLMYECTTFLVQHRKDGRNQSSRATYQCHYNPLNNNFVAVRRVKSEDTRNTHSCLYNQI